MVLRPFRVGIIPLREIIGNYNPLRVPPTKPPNYTLERDNRELQQKMKALVDCGNYTLERDNRELQPCITLFLLNRDYTLERDNRELQPLTTSI